MRRSLAAAAVATVLAAPAAGASLVPAHGPGRSPGHRRHQQQHRQLHARLTGAGPTGGTPLWLAGSVSYQWSGDRCAGSSGAWAGSGDPGAAGAPAGATGTAPGSTPCTETFTNVVTASVSTSQGQLLAPLSGQQLSFTWYGDVVTPKQAGQWSCTIVVTGTGAEPPATAGSGTSVDYTSSTVSSPDCAVDSAQGPPASQSLEATGTCMSCSFEGYLGQPIRIDYQAPGATVLDNGFPANTNTR